jgi:membrane protein implicated in regulation of membrane protease activity
MLAAEFGTGQVFLSMLFFFLFFILIWLVIAIFADIFRSPDLSGWAKALWVLFVIVLPFLGVFSYLIVRGHKMRDYATAGTNRRDEVYRMYVGDLTPRP